MGNTERLLKKCVMNLNLDPRHIVYKNFVIVSYKKMVASGVTLELSSQKGQRYLRDMNLFLVRPQVPYKSLEFSRRVSLSPQINVDFPTDSNLQEIDKILRRAATSNPFDRVGEIGISTNQFTTRPANEINSAYAAAVHAFLRDDVEGAKALFRLGSTHAAMYDWEVNMVRIVNEGLQLLERGTQEFSAWLAEIHENCIQEVCPPLKAWINAE